MLGAVCILVVGKGPLILTFSLEQCVWSHRIEEERLL